MVDVPQQNKIPTNVVKPSGPAQAPVAAPPLPNNKTVNKIKPDSGRSREVLTCTTAFLALVAAVFLFISVTNSKTGFFDIPWLVADYVPEQPVRRVPYTPMSWGELNQYVAMQVNRENQEHGPPLEVLLSESQLTGMLVDSLGLGLRDQSTEVRLVQMAILPDGMEMTVRLTWRKILNLDLSGTLVPSVAANGDLHFEVAQAKLGHVVLPNSWLWPVLRYVFTRDLGVWQIKVGDDFVIREIKLTDGTLELLFGPVTPAQP